MVQLGVRVAAARGGTGRHCGGQRRQLPGGELQRQRAQRFLELVAPAGAEQRNDVRALRQTQAMATCATLAPMSRATARSFSTSARLCARFAPWNLGLWARKSRPPAVVAPDQWPLIRPRDSTP